jgi:surface protein
MKKYYLFFIVNLVGLYTTYGQDAFISVWHVYDESFPIHVPIVATDATLYTIDFGDGQIVTGQTGPVEHIYAGEGNYTITISGNVDRICFGDDNFSAGNIHSIEQWGDIQWKSMASAFKDCNNLEVIATDTPDLSQVSDMSFMFSHTEISTITALFTNFDAWDVSNVTNMESLFEYSGLSLPVSSWDVSNVTNMKNLFYQVVWYNNDVQNWDVSNVTNMQGLFANTNYNYPLENWDVSNVTNMSAMFQSVDNFNQPINTWDVSNVTDMSNLFDGAESFNQPLDSWDVSNVTNMLAMFGLALDFNQPLDSWDVSNVTNMASMFQGGYQQESAFNQSLSTWDTSAVTNMISMFKWSTSFNQPLENFDVSNVTSMKSMFDGATSFNQSLANWDVSNVTDMGVMFRDATSFNGSVENWDTAAVTDMIYMFNGAEQFNQPLNSWDVSSVTDMRFMFEDASAFNQPLSNWNVENVTKISRMFNNASSFNQDISNWNLIFNMLNSGQFLSNSGLDMINYDKFLLKLSQTGLSNRTLGAEQLNYCDTGVHEYLINQRGWTIVDDGVGADCLTNDVSGTVFYDENDNGCDLLDVALTNYIVRAEGENFTYASGINAEGQYDLDLFESTYELNLLNIPTYFSVTPPSSTFTFTDSGNTENIDFCITANQTIADLNITLIPVTQARPGFDSQYQLVAQNMGTQTLASAEVTFSFDSAKQTFVTAVPAATTMSAGQLNFTVASLKPLQAQTYDITLLTIEPPTVNGGDILAFSAAITPNTNDYTPEDNTVTLNQVVVNSFDPNDKQVLQGEEILIDNADQYLDYLIRFQNTGSASAINIRVRDTLHPKLDWATLKPISASHAYHIEIRDNNHVEFIFDNINLPDSMSDEPASHGFIAYKIKPIQGVQVGDVITGDAGIFFDFNQPIITNTVSTTITSPLGNTDLFNDILKLYPNPASSIINLRAQTNVTIKDVKVYNMIGVELRHFKQDLEAINISDLNTGMYILIVQTNRGFAKYRLIKK